MAVKTPIKATFSGSDVNGLAEYESGDFIGVAAGGTGAVTHTANSILLGNGTSALQSSEIQISGTTLSSSDSTTISIAEGLIVTGDLTVQGTTTTVDSSTINVVDRFVFEGSSDDDNETTLVAANPDADRTVTIPNATGTIVLKDTTDTLTNKTISGSSNTLSNIGNSSLSNSTITVSADSGSNNAVDLGDTLTVSGGEGIDTSVSGDEITIAGEDASTSNKGVASFSSSDFSVSSGAVSIKSGGVSNTQLANSAITINGTSTSLGGSITLPTGDLPITFGDDSSNNFDITLGDGFSFLGGSGIDTTVSGPTVTIAAEDASSSNKGVASFSSDNFSVSSGAVTIKDGGVALAELADAAANTVIVRDANSSGVLSAKAVTDTQILIGDGTGFTAAALSGDVTMTNAGVVTIANGAVENAMLAGSIANAKLANSSVTINGSSVSLGGSMTITGSELSAGDIFSNPNTISSNATFTTASTKNAFLKGDITVSGDAVMTIDGDGVLTLI